MNDLRTSAGMAMVSLVFSVGALAAQEPTPLRYHQRTMGQMTVMAPTGPVELGNEVDAHLSFVEVGPDSLHAWFDDLEVAAIDPGGETRPDTDPILGELFVLRVGERGALETLASPEAPAPVSSVTDLRAQFFDFLPTIPDGGYRVGATWADTLMAPPAVEPDTESEMTKVVTSRVVSDSVADGVPVWVIHAEAMTEWRIDAPFPDQPTIRVVTTMTGVETSVALVARDDGRLLSRDRVADIEGQMEYVGAPQPLLMAITRRNESEIRLIR
jgi:hypothetical protein